MNSFKGPVQRFCGVTLVEITHPQYWNSVWTARRVRFWCRALKVITHHHINFFLCGTAPSALRVAITGKFFILKKETLFIFNGLCLQNIEMSTVCQEKESSSTINCYHLLIEQWQWTINEGNHYAASWRTLHEHSLP